MVIVDYCPVQSNGTYLLVKSFVSNGRIFVASRLMVSVNSKTTLLPLLKISILRGKGINVPSSPLCISSACSAVQAG